MALIRQKQFFWKWLLAGLLITMTLLAYIPAMRGDFIWDDKEWIRDNPNMRTLDGLRRIWVEPRANVQYYPLMFTSFWVEYQLWGLQPFVCHLINVLFHAFNAIFLWQVLLHLRVPGAWMAAAIFALHPVHLESVAWIVERKNVLSGFFYLSALLLYLRFSLPDNHLPNDPGEFSRNPHASAINNRRIGLYLLSIGLFACALLSKSVTCTLPAVILLLLWWKRDRLLWRDLRPLTPLFILGAALAMITAWVEKYHAGAQGEGWEFSFLEQCLLAGRAFWFYAGKLIWPHEIIFIYPRWQIDSGIWWQYLFPIAASAAVFLLWLLRNRIGKAPLVAILVFGGNLVPALGFFNVYFMRYSFVADHFQYLASISFIVLCIACVTMIFHRAAPGLRGVELGLSAVLLAILGVLVWNEGHKYKNPETIWSDTLAKNPQCWMAYNGLGMALAEQGRTAEAIDHYTMALGIKPDYEIAHYNLGLALEKQGRIDQAISHYSEALRIDPHFFGLHYVMGIALERQGRIDQAINHYYEELRINPYCDSAHRSLGNAMYAKGRLDKAIGHYSEALRINPDSEAAHINLGNVWVAQRKFDVAIRHYSEALRINPDSVKAHINLANAFRDQGKFDGAFKHYTEALGINPDSVKAHINLANILKQQGRIALAIEHYTEALRIDPDFAGAHINLANALLVQGRFDEAIRHYSEALRINPDSAEVHMNLGNAFFAKERLHKAIGHYSEALRIRPELTGARENLEKVLAEQAKISEDIAKIQGELKLDPGNPELHYRLGNLYKRTGDLGEAADQYKKALSINPGFIAALNNMATVYMINQEYDKALSAFKKMVGLRPDRSGIYYNIACIYARQNKIKESIDWLNKAIQRGYKNWDLIKTDKDLENIRGSSHYNEIITGR